MSAVIDIFLQPNLGRPEGSRAGRLGVSDADDGSYDSVRPVVVVAVERGIGTGMALWISFGQLQCSSEGSVKTHTQINMDV